MFRIAYTGMTTSGILRIPLMGDTLLPCVAKRILLAGVIRFLGLSIMLSKNQMEMRAGEGGIQRWRTWYPRQMEEVSVQMLPVSCSWMLSWDGTMRGFKIKHSQGTTTRGHFRDGHTTWGTFISFIDDRNGLNGTPLTRRGSWPFVVNGHCTFDTSNTLCIVVAWNNVNTVLTSAM